ncbi:hypothetical protein [Coralloluteibacterium thermophilus]|uniref:Uncharacterized protein n=1 Tax=Coralloluteibacterium thermophilum TaxID=2707049 RepID=A0ABV9NS54_9GAMM
MSLPELIDYAQWKKLTWRTFSVRAPQLKLLDAAIKAYTERRSDASLKAVRTALDGWKQSKGPGDAWKKSSRDRNDAIKLLDAQLSGKGDTDVALGAKEFMAPALVNARLGVLYLFGNLDCDDSVFKLVLHGAMDVTTSTLSLPSVDGDAAKTASKVIGNARMPVGLVAEKLESKLREQSGRKKVVSSSQLGTAASPPPTDPLLRRAWEFIRSKVQDFAERMWKLICEKLTALQNKIKTMAANPSDALLGTMPKLLRALCDQLVGQFLKTAAPFISGGLDIAKGVASTLDAGYTKFREWLDSRDVALMAGHATTIVQAIRRAMWFSVGEGLYDTLKGTAKLAVDAAAAGASALMGIIISICEIVAKTIWRIVEVLRIRGFLSQAQAYWEIRNESNALHHRPIAFNAWFKSNALTLPALSVLALNSGVVGDKMHFLKMFKDDDTVMSQSAFNAGCTYLDGLKVWGSDYLEDAGFSFSSRDKVVEGLLKLTTSHRANPGTAGKAWQATLGFLGA